MLEDLFEQRATLRRRVHRLTGRDRQQTMDALQALEAFLQVGLELEGPMLTGDAMADEWERIIAEGGLPAWMNEPLRRPAAHRRVGVED